MVYLRFFNNTVSSSSSVNIVICSSKVVYNLSPKETTKYFCLDGTVDCISVTETSTDKLLYKQKVKLDSRCYYTIILNDTELLAKKNRCLSPEFGQSLIFIYNIHTKNTPVDFDVNGAKYMCEYGYVLTIKSGLENITVSAPSGNITLRPTNQSIYSLFYTTSGFVSVLDSSSDKYAYDFVLTKFTGKWYQIGYIQPTTSDCYKVSMVYTPLQDGTVKTLTTCYNRNLGINNASEEKGISGNKPKIVATNNELTQIIHTTDYEKYAVVGSPHRNYLYILCRTKTMSERLFEQLVVESNHLGYNIQKMNSY